MASSVKAVGRGPTDPYDRLVYPRTPAPAPPARQSRQPSIGAEQERLRQLGQDTKAKPLLRDQVFELVDKAASSALWRVFGTPGNRGVDRVKVRSDLWQTPEGRELSNLSNSDYGRMEAAKARRAIAENPAASARFAKALRILDRGRLFEEPR